MNKDVACGYSILSVILSQSTVRGGAHRQRGLTLIELMATLAVAMLLVAVGMPDIGAISDKRHLKGTVESIQQDLRLARAEAVKRNQKVYVAFKGSGSNWCYGINAGATCDCTIANNCAVDNVERVRNSTDLGQGAVSLLATTFSGADTRFDPVHGTADAGSVKLQSAQGVDVKVIVSPMGRIRACSPDNPNKYGFVTTSCNP